MIHDCILTHSNTRIIRGWSVPKNYQDYNVKIHTGVDVSASDVYSVCTGLVLFVGTDPDNPQHKVVIVQYDANLVFRYCNLSSVSAEVGTEVDIGQLVGTADHFVHFEAMCFFPPKTELRVNIYNRTYYKIDPTKYVDGTISLADVVLEEEKAFGLH